MLNDNDNKYTDAMATDADYRYEKPEYNPKKNSEKQKNGNRKGSVIAVALACAMIGGLGGGAVTGYVLSDNQSSAVQTTQTGSGTDSGSDSADLTLSQKLSMTANDSDTVMTPAQIYSNYSSAVVGIATESTTMNVFGQTTTAASSGTGMIVSADGYILTNYHVIEDAQKITVTLIDGTSYTAELIGGDEESDVALLKIDASGLSAVSFGDSDSLVTGETVVAIGNPLGELTYTLTVGYVSAVDRDITMDDGTILNMIQTDAAINAGNSGGPLFDLNGNVIGMVTAKYSSDSIEGLGFALPINDVKDIMADLLNYGYVKGRPALGISVQDVTETMSQYYNLPVGIYVASVDSDGAADEAGINKGDIITAVNGTSIETYAQLKAFLADYKAGETINVTVYRNGSSQTFSVVLDEQEASDSSSTDSTVSGYYGSSTGGYSQSSATM